MPKYESSEQETLAFLVDGLQFNMDALQDRLQNSFQYLDNRVTALAQKSTNLLEDYLSNGYVQRKIAAMLLDNKDFVNLVVTAARDDGSIFKKTSDE